MILMYVICIYNDSFCVDLKPSLHYGIKNIAAPYNVMEVEQVKKKATKKIKQEYKKEKENIKMQERADEVANFAKNATSIFFFNGSKLSLFFTKSLLSSKISFHCLSNVSEFLAISIFLISSVIIFI